MALSADQLFSYSGSLFDVCLLLVLTIRGRWRNFPAFSLLILFDLLSSTLVLAGNLWSNRLIYALLDIISVSLQFAVVLELLRSVIPRESKLGGQARKVFLSAFSIGLLLAGAASFVLAPPRMHGAALYETRADVFASLLICETVIAIMLAAQQVGLGWRNHLIAIAQGLMLWALLLVFIEGLGPYLNFHNSVYDKLYYVRSLTYIGLLGYWSVALWREEPARKPISPALRKYIVALHDQVQYDLGKTGH